MNYMAEVAKMLGVEIGEEFEINSINDGILIGKFTKMGFCVKSKDGSKLRYNAKMDVLYELLIGVFTVKCKPWKPTCGEIYWSISGCGEPLLAMWKGGTKDYNFYKLGNCYRTEAEAKIDSGKWISFYASDEVLEV